MEPNDPLSAIPEKPSANFIGTDCMYYTRAPHYESITSNYAVRNKLVVAGNTIEYWQKFANLPV